MNLYSKIYLILYKFWYNKVILRYMVALVGWAKMDYKNSWKFKERYNVMGLDYAADYEKHWHDISYHMKTCPRQIKARLFIDALILFKPYEQIPYYYV